MSRTGGAASRIVMAVAGLALIVLGVALGTLHARAFGIGGRSPALSFDAAQYAVAARTLAEHGTFATTFALPIDLVAHATPPWPLSVVQPGLVVLEAGVEKLVPPTAPWPGGGRWDTPRHREWLAILVSFAAYLLLALVIAAAVRSRLDALDPSAAGIANVIVAFGAGAAFLLDPEAQHLALGGFTELPYTLGLTAALALLAAGWPARRPFAWGLLLGATATVRGNLLVVLPVLCVAAAALAPRPRRAWVVLAVLFGCALPLAPWWWYKWRAFGHPNWDLSVYALFDGVGGRTWFSLTHRAVLPPLPHGWDAIAAIAPKFARQLGWLASEYASAPSGVWTLVLLFALAAPIGEPTGLAPDPAARRAARYTVLVSLALAVLALTVAAAGAGWRRYVFPARVPVEAAGFIAAWLGLERARHRILAGVPRRALALALVAFALGWGTMQTRRGNAEAAAVADTRGLPSIATFERLAAELDARLAPGESVMSNLGSTLAWYAGRPVLHLALDPSEVMVCRTRLEFRDVLLVFRGPEHAWPAWSPIVGSATATVPGLRESGRERTADGFTVVWLRAGR